MKQCLSSSANTSVALFEHTHAAVLTHMDTGEVSDWRVRDLIIGER